LTETILKFNPAKITSAFDLPADGINLEGFIAEIEKSYILQALRRTHGNQTRAAELLKMSVRSLRHLLDKHKIRQTASLLRDTSESN
ncbi:MAG TPA: helix-turn-helix domain-containing protein, partial [Acidobacteriota bacterium]|nr:helix-turn-helix domain-containing protein [Acidobacteriota bacterium]